MKARDHRRAGPAARSADLVGEALRALVDGLVDGPDGTGGSVPEMITFFNIHGAMVCVDESRRVAARCASSGARPSG